MMILLSSFVERRGELDQHSQRSGLLHSERSEDWSYKDLRDEYWPSGRCAVCALLCKVLLFALCWLGGA